MKKLLSILATLGMTATASAAVVACSVKKTNGNAKVDSDGNVTVRPFKLWMSKDFSDINGVNKYYSVFDKNGNAISGAQLVSTDTNVTKFDKAKRYEFTATFKIDKYDSKKDYLFYVGTINATNDNDLKGHMARRILPVEIKPTGSVDPTKDPDYVGWTNGDGTVKMGKPTVGPEYIPDGSGYFQGTDSATNKKEDGTAYPKLDNANKSVSISAGSDGNDEAGYPVDTEGTKDKNIGFGNRVVIGDDGKPVVGGKCTAVPDSDGNNENTKVYLDNDGYRIAYDKTANNGKGGWVRVSADGTHKLGPDSAPNSGKNAWAENSGSETNVADGLKPNVSKDVAAYVERDSSGKVIKYLDKNGNPVDSDGKALPNEPQADPAENEYKNSNEKGHENVDAKYGPAVKKNSDGTDANAWTLNGNIPVTLGNDVKNNGSITVGEQDKNGKPVEGKSVTINPNDPDSHDWKTIKDGKYAGMQARLSPDGKSVEFRWPVTDKQVQDIVNQDSGEDSPISKDKDGNANINVPMSITDGKNGTGKKISNNVPSSVKVTTPWDQKDSTDEKAKNKWWIDANTADGNQLALSYKDLSDNKEIPIKVRLTKSLADAMSSEKTFVNPQIDIDNTLSFSWDEKGIQTDDNGSFIEGSVKATNINSFRDSTNANVDFSKTFVGFGTVLNDMKTYATVALTKINMDVVFGDPVKQIDSNNKISWTISKVASDLDYKDAEIKELDKDGKSIDCDSSIMDTPVWDQTSKTLSVSFKDGKLQYNQDIKFMVTFKTKEGNISSTTKAPLVAQKRTASDSEKTLSFKAAGTAAPFNGNMAVWDVDKIGSLVGKSNDDVNVKVTSLRKNTLVAVEEDIKSTFTWDGNELSVSVDAGSEGPQGEYSVEATFKLTNGFTKTINATLQAKRDTGKDINWANGVTSFNFGTGDSITATLDKTKNQNFNGDLGNAKVESLSGLVEKTDYEYTWDAGKGNLTIKLLKEQKQGNYNFSVVLSDKNDSSQLNATILNTVKDKPIDAQTHVDWESTSVGFDDNGHSMATFKVKDAGEDIDLTKATITIKDEKLNNNLKSQPVWDASKKSFSVELKNDIPAGVYKLTATFAYGNGYGYEGSTSGNDANLSINKDAPMDSEARVVFTTAQGSFDNSKTVTYEMADHGSDVDLGSQPDVKLKDGNVPAGTLTPTWDKNTMTLTITLNGEIPGGTNTLEVTFGLLNGYKGTSVPAEITATKTVPNPDQTESVAWTSDTTVDAPLSDNDDATFTVDKRKTGQDIDLVNGPEITVDKDKSTNPDNIPKYTKTWDKDKRQLTVHFEEAQSKWKAAFKVTFGIGNGYTSDKKVEAPEISVEKTKASAYEKAIDIENINTVLDFNETNKGSWKVTNYGPEIDIENPTSVSVKNTTTPEGPVDYQKAKIDNNGNITGPKKDAQASKQFSVAKGANNTATINLAYNNGDLWAGQYTVELTYKLKNYDETVKVTLKFSKLKANKKEANVSDNSDNKIVVTSHGNIVVWKSYAEADITIDNDFGIDVAFLNPDISAKGKKSRWIFQSKSEKDGKITMVFFNWKIFDQIGILLGSHVEFTISFGIVGFPDQSSEIKITSE